MKELKEENIGREERKLFQIQFGNDSYTTDDQISKQVNIYQFFWIMKCDNFIQKWKLPKNSQHINVTNTVHECFNNKLNIKILYPTVIQFYK